MRKSVVQTIVEAVTYLSLGYLTLPAHEQQWLRLAALRAIDRSAFNVAVLAAKIAARAETAYRNEVGV